MSRHREQVAAALAAVTVRGPTRYAWLGRASRPLPASLAAELGPPERRRYLVSCLREELYCSFYCHGGPVPAQWGEPEPPFADPRLVAAMSRAGAGRGSWEPGWTVRRRDGELAVVESDRLRARVPVGDCRPAAGAVRPGVAVSLRVPSRRPELSPGFFTVLGDAPADEPSQGGVRVYWNVGPAGAPALVGAVSSRLNREGVPFRLKVANHPHRLRRCDAAVLYLRSETFVASRGMLRELADTPGIGLRPEVPAFTLALAPGVGLAEDTPDGESFGIRRCELLADAIVRAHEHGVTRADGRLETVAARFAEEGVRIDAPYLEPSLAGRHVLP